MGGVCGGGLMEICGREVGGRCRTGEGVGETRWVGAKCGGGGGGGGVGMSVVGGLDRRHGLLSLLDLKGMALYICSLLQFSPNC